MQQTNLNLYFNKHLEKIKRHEENKKRIKYLKENNLLLREYEDDPRALAYLYTDYNLLNDYEYLNIIHLIESNTQTQRDLNLNIIGGTI